MKKLRKFNEHIRFTDTSSIKNSTFDIYDGSEIIENGLSYDDVCKYLNDNKYKLFGKYVRVKISNKWWEADYFLKHEVE